MTKPHTMLDTARLDAQNLHKKISENIAKAKAATWAEVQAVQGEAAVLVTKMKDIANGQADALKTGITSATDKLEAATKLVQSKVAAGKDDVQHANAALLAASHNAAQSLSNAVAEFRSKAAKVIEPKKVSA